LTAAQSLERSQAWPPPLTVPVLGFALSYITSIWIVIILSAFCLPCKSRTGEHLRKLPMVRRTSFCKRCNFKR